MELQKSKIYIYIYTGNIYAIVIVITIIIEMIIKCNIEISLLHSPNL